VTARDDPSVQTVVSQEPFRENHRHHGNFQTNTHLNGQAFFDFYLPSYLRLLPPERSSTSASRVIVDFCFSKLSSTSTSQVIVDFYLSSYR